MPANMHPVTMTSSSEQWLLTASTDAGCAAWQQWLDDLRRPEAAAQAAPTFSALRARHGLASVCAMDACQAQVDAHLRQGTRLLHLCVLTDDPDMPTHPLVPALTRDDTRRVVVHLVRPGHAASLLELLNRPDALLLEQWLQAGRPANLGQAIAGAYSEAEAAALSAWAGDWLDEVSEELMDALYGPAEASIAIAQPLPTDEARPAPTSVAGEVHWQIQSPQEAQGAWQRGIPDSAPFERLAADSGDGTDQVPQEPLQRWVLPASRRKLGTTGVDAIQAWVRRPPQGSALKRPPAQLGFELALRNPVWRQRTDWQLQVHLPFEMPLLLDLDESGSTAEVLRLVTTDPLLDPDGSIEQALPKASLTLTYVERPLSDTH